MLLVQKFGGTSVADAIRRLVAIALGGRGTAVERRILGRIVNAHRQEGAGLQAQPCRAQHHLNPYADGPWVSLAALRGVLALPHGRGDDLRGQRVDRGGRARAYAWDHTGARRLCRGDCPARLGAGLCCGRWVDGASREADPVLKRVGWYTGADSVSGGIATDDHRRAG